jgi:hypothetical protein
VRGRSSGRAAGPTDARLVHLQRTSALIEADTRPSRAWGAQVARQGASLRRSRERDSPGIVFWRTSPLRQFRFCIAATRAFDPEPQREMD